MEVEVRVRVRGGGIGVRVRGRRVRVEGVEGRVKSSKTVRVCEWG